LQQYPLLKGNLFVNAGVTAADLAATMRLASRTTLAEPSAFFAEGHACAPPTVSIVINARANAITPAPSTKCLAIGIGERTTFGRWNIAQCSS